MVEDCLVGGQGWVGVVVGEGCAGVAVRIGGGAVCFCRGEFGV